MKLGSNQKDHAPCRKQLETTVVRGAGASGLDPKDIDRLVGESDSAMVDIDSAVADIDSAVADNDLVAKHTVEGS